MLYLDTSCWLKVFFPEPETSRTLELIAADDRVVLSTLGRLEGLSHVHARVAGGTLPRSRARRMIAQMDAVLRQAPYELASWPAEAWNRAESRVRLLGKAEHCRTLDRLHLGCMSALGLRRILTNDDAQARAARAAGFEVVLPRA